MRFGGSLLKRLLFFGFVLCLLAVGYVYAPWPAREGERTETRQGLSPSGGSRDRAAFVTLATVAVTPYDNHIRAIGTGRAKQSVEVVSDVSGTIESIHFSPNSDVGRGDPLVTLNSDLERIELDIARAEQAQAQATIRRYETLEKSGSGAVAAVTVEEARTALQLADASVERAEYDLSKRVITAPIDGRLGLDDLNEGAYLASGAKVVTIDDTATLVAEFVVPERAAEVLRLGYPIRATTPSIPGRTFEGEVTAFDSRVDAETRTILVRAEIDNPDGLLWPGMTFEIEMFDTGDPAPSVPAVSVVWGREGAFVWKVADGRATMVPVTIRSRLDDTVWVDADLAQGDRVVLDGVQKVYEGGGVTTEDDRPSAEDDARISRADRGELRDDASLPRPMTGVAEARPAPAAQRQ
jgi:RND family efflux transporter MFP subunit